MRCSAIAQYVVLDLDLADCEPLACSEVRAARAAECSHLSFDWAKRSCTQSLAERATMTVMGPEKGTRCVANVFTKCFASKLDRNPLAPEGDARK